MALAIKDLLEKIIDHNKSWQITLLSQWQAIMGNLNSRVQLLKIEDDTLHIGVTDSCWMQELYLLTPVLLAKINQTLDQPRIKHLRFKSVGMPTTQAPKKQPISKQSKDRVITLCPFEESVLGQLQDDTLAAALRKYRMRCYQEKEK